MEVMIFALQQQAADGFVVKIMPPPSDVEGLADVLVGSLSLTGVLVLSAVGLAILFAAALFVFRLKLGDPYPSASEQRPGDEGQGGRITR